MQHCLGLHLALWIGVFRIFTTGYNNNAHTFPKPLVNLPWVKTVNLWPHVGQNLNDVSTLVPQLEQYMMYVWLKQIKHKWQEIIINIKPNVVNEAN